MKIQELFDIKEKEINDIITPETDALFERILEHYDEIYDDKQANIESSEYAKKINFKLKLTDIDKVYEEIKKIVENLDIQKTTSKQALNLLERVLKKEKKILDINRKHQELIDWQKGMIKRDGGAYANFLLKDAKSKRLMSLVFVLKFMHESVGRIAFIKGRVFQNSAQFPSISS
jgi:hypothetical protein